MSNQEEQAQDSLTYLMTNEVSVLPGFNPRKFFDDALFRELVASVKETGVVQPIIVRPKTDNSFGYWIVAGERRYRAAIEAKLTEIPVVIKNLSDNEAQLVATIENTHRDDMAPSEEAEAARKILTGCNNDRKEAMRLLGWSQFKFESRLLLLHAAPDVLDALTQRKIKLGHAELLSQLPHDIQTATLAKIVEHGYSVSDLKERVSSYALEISKACFNLTDCMNCPHNSALQATLFEESIGTGKCGNRPCYENKTKEAIEQKKRELSEKYPLIFLDTERAPSTFKIVCQQGNDGVGKTQLEQGCRQCAHFGAVLSTSPNSLGKITEDCCFKLECHKEKVAEYQAASRPAPVKHPPAEAKTKAENSDAEKKKSGPEKSQGSTKASAAEVPTKVAEKIETFFRELGAKEAAKDKRMSLLLNTFALYRLVRPTCIGDSFLPQGLDRYDSSLDKFLKAVSVLEINEIVSINHHLIATLLGEHEKTMPGSQKIWATGAACVTSILNIDLSDHFKIDEEFLGSFTKSGIESVLKEAVNANGERFVEYYESKEGQVFSKLMKKKNNEIIEEVFNCGYDFTGFVPSCVLKVQVDNKAQKEEKEINPNPQTISQSQAA